MLRRRSSACRTSNSTSSSTHRLPRAPESPPTQPSPTPGSCHHSRHLLSFGLAKAKELARCNRS
jgi:hypothetical protein